MSARPAISPESNKRNSLLQAIHRRGTASRVQLAKALHISNSRVCGLVDRMVAEGLLSEQVGAGGPGGGLGGGLGEAGGGGRPVPGRRETRDRRGRRGVAVGLNPDYAHLIGFDMEALRLRAVITDFTGRLVWQQRKHLTPTHTGEELLDEILNFLDDAVKEARLKHKRLLGVGLAASGVIDAGRGVILHYDLIPGAVDLPLRDKVAERVGLPCVMENNIRAMTLAEWTGGAARGLSSFVCLAIRSGVGAGVVVDGRLLAGSHGLCGEAGYMVLPTAGNPSQWRNLQQTVSESALGVDADAPAWDVPEAAARRAGELIGSQIASIAALLDPEAVVLAGELLKPDGPVWLHAVATFRQTALSELVKRVRVLPAQLGPYAAAVGAAHRCLYELYPVVVGGT